MAIRSKAERLLYLLALHVQWRNFLCSQPSRLAHDLILANPFAHKDNPIHISGYASQDPAPASSEAVFPSFAESRMLFDLYFPELSELASCHFDAIKNFHELLLLAYKKYPELNAIDAAKKVDDDQFKQRYIAIADSQEELRKAISESTIKRINL